MRDIEIDPYAPPPNRKRKEADREALQSPLNRIPGIDIATVRDLLDIGIREPYGLMGRAPETLFDAIRKKKPATPIERLALLRLAVYYVETPEPEQAKLNAWAWK